MFDKEYSIGAAIKNPEWLKFVPDHLKAKKCVTMKLKNFCNK